MSTDSLFELSFTDNHGQPVSLKDFEGRPVLIVNTASKCGFTPQYDGLQKLHEEYADKGLTVLGFPCDQFAHQEPGNDDQIEEFCRVNYGVTFPLSTKVEVNGKGAHPIFQWLKSHGPKSITGSAIKWNFTKFLVSGDAATVRRFSPQTDPSKLKSEIERLLFTS